VQDLEQSRRPRCRKGACRATLSRLTALGRAWVWAREALHSRVKSWGHPEMSGGSAQASIKHTSIWRKPSVIIGYKHRSRSLQCRATVPGTYGSEQ
jgi:hypothetical protein